MGKNEVEEFISLVENCNEYVQSLVISWLSVTIDGKYRYSNLKQIMACIVSNTLYPDIVNVGYLYDLKLCEKEIVKNGTIFGNKYILTNLGTVAFYNDEFKYEFSSLENELLELVKNDLIKKINTKEEQEIKKKKEYLDKLFE